MDIKKEYERWLANATADADVAAELKTLDDAKIEDSPRLKYSIDIGITANSRLNLSGAGNICPEALLPPVQLPTPSGLCLGVGVEKDFMLHKRYPPA